MDFYTELKSWQTSIGAALGFIALIAGALFNFWLNRRRDFKLRNEEAFSVALALYGEILLLQKEAADLANLVTRVAENSGVRRFSTKLDRYFVEAHALPEPTLYEALAPKLGLLRPDTALAVTRFYARYHEVRSWLPRIVEDHERGYDFSVLAVLQPACDAVKEIAPTLRAIESLAGIPKPATDIDIRAVESFVEMEKEIFVPE